MAGRWISGCVDNSSDGANDRDHQLLLTVEMGIRRNSRRQNDSPFSGLAGTANAGGLRPVESRLANSNRKSSGRPDFSDAWRFSSAVTL